MKTVIAALIALLVIGAVLWVVQYGNMRAENALLDTRLDALANTSARQAREFTADSTRLADSLATLERAAESLRADLQASRQTARRTQVALEQARAVVSPETLDSLPDGVRRLLAATEDAMRAAVAEASACDASLENCRAQVVNLREQLNRRDTRIAELTALHERTRELLDAERRRHRLTPLKFFSNHVPKIAALGLLILVVTR